MIYWLTQENLNAFKMSLTEDKYRNYLSHLDIKGSNKESVVIFFAYNQDALTNNVLPTDVSTTEAYCALVGYKTDLNERDLLILGSYFIDKFIMNGLIVDLNDYINIATDVHIMSSANAPVARNGVLNIPSPIMVIDTASYKDNTAIEKVVFNGLNVYVCQSAFEGCKNLKTIEFNSHLTFVDIAAFKGTGVTSLCFPASMRRICEESFAECVCLEHLDINDGLYFIGDDAFRDACRLKTVELPVSVKTLGDHAFALNTVLESINVNRVENVGARCFASDRALKQLRFTTSLKSLGCAFAEGCTSLTDIYVPGVIDYIDSNAFSGLPKTCTIHVEAINKDASVIANLIGTDIKYEVI